MTATYSPGDPSPGNTKTRGPAAGRGRRLDSARHSTRGRHQPPPSPRRPRRPMWWWSGNGPPSGRPGPERGQAWRAGACRRPRSEVTSVLTGPRSQCLDLLTVDRACAGSAALVSAGALRGAGVERVVTALTATGVHADLPVTAQQCGGRDKAHGRVGRAPRHGRLVDFSEPYSNSGLPPLPPLSTPRSNFRPGVTGRTQRTRPPPPPPPPAAITSTVSAVTPLGTVKAARPGVLNVRGFRSAGTRVAPSGPAARAAAGTSAPQRQQQLGQTMTRQGAVSARLRRRALDSGLWKKEVGPQAKGSRRRVTAGSSSRTKPDSP